MVRNGNRKCCGRMCVFAEWSVFCCRYHLLLGYRYHPPNNIFPRDSFCGLLKFSSATARSAFSESIFARSQAGDLAILFIFLPWYFIHVIKYLRPLSGISNVLIFHEIIRRILVSFHFDSNDSIKYDYEVIKTECLARLCTSFFCSVWRESESIMVRRNVPKFANATNNFKKEIMLNQLTAHFVENCFKYTVIVIFITK